MLKKTGIIFITVGSILILSALVLLSCNINEERVAGENAEILMNDIRSIIEEKQSILQTAQNDDEIPTVTLDGYEYIGYISVSEPNIELPVFSEWDYDRLKTAPCRQFGSAKTNDLVIAAHNYKTHFGVLSKLSIGTEICFTDMHGTVNTYTLLALKLVEPEDVNAIQNSDYDLVLYTCTSTGASRVVAFCNRITD